MSHKKASTDHRQRTGTTTHAQEPRNPVPSHTADERDLADRKGRSSIDDAPSYSLPTAPVLVTSGNSYQKPHNFEGRADQISSPPYGHHRQTSIVNGIQHSRNTSLVTSKSNSPLSPQAVGAGQLAGNSSTHNNMRASLNEKTDSPTASRRPSTSDTTIRPSASKSSTDSNALSNSSQSEAKKAGQKNSLASQASTSLRKEKMRSQSQSRSELKTVGEYALHHLFNSFVGLADSKINQCLNHLREPEPMIELIFGPGVDPAFDQLITALGHIAKHKPKPLIDTLMFWRKAKKENARIARNELDNMLLNAFPNESVAWRNSLAEHPDPFELLPPQIQGPFASRQLSLAQAERRSLISVHLLCRVLIEVVNQTSLDALTGEMAAKLEKIIHGQLNGLDAEQLRKSPIKQANWKIFSQLLGVLSDMDFEHVAGLFLVELDKLQPRLIIKSALTKDIETKAVLHIKSMKKLKLGMSTDQEWERSCKFMNTIASFFSGVHGTSVKYSYCQTLEELLLPIAENATSQLNLPKWKEVIGILRSRLSTMLAKPKHWHEAFPVMVVLLCSSPPDFFLSQWTHYINTLQPKLKDRTCRPIALRGICRLLWTYLYRVSDVHSATIRRLDEIVKLVFQSGRKSYLSTEANIAEPLIRIIRIIGFKYRDLCFKNIIFPLMNADTFISGKEYKADNLEPERMVVGIRAFLTIIGDLEKGEQPPFPHNFESEPAMQSFTFASQGFNTRTNPQSSTKYTVVKEERLSRPVLTASFDDSVLEYYNRFCAILGQVTMICDNAFGGQAVLDEKFSSQAPKTPMSDAFGGFIRRDDFQSSTETRQGFYDLFHVAVQALPRCLSAHIPFTSLINLLCTGTAHVQSSIANSSAQSLKSIAKQGFAQQVTIGFARFIFNFDDLYSTLSDGGMLGVDHIENTLGLYIELLQIWIEEIKQKSKRVMNNTTEDNHGGARGTNLDRSALWAHVDEIESHGLFFLCLPTRRVRHFAVIVLRLIKEFDTALGKRSMRIIQIMEGSPQEIINTDDEKLTLVERSRLEQSLQNTSLRNTLAEVCCSDSPYDVTLWFKIFPNFVRASNGQCPTAIALTKDIIGLRISQMQKVISSIADWPRGAPQPFADYTHSKSISKLATTDTEIIIEQWKIYLIFACTALNNLGFQGEVTVATPQHGRKGSKPSQNNSDRFGSAMELFTKVVPLLSSGNSAVRQAVVAGLGSINANLYRTLLESLQTSVANCNEEAKARLSAHQRTVSSPRKIRRTDHLRTEITHVYKLTSHFLRYPMAYNDDWILNNLVNFTKDLRLFLNDAEIQNEWGYQKLRMYYCGLVENLFEGINKTKDPLRWMPFQARKAAFALMEEWSGFSPNQSQIRQREDNMRKSILESEFESGDKGMVSAAMEIEKRDLRFKALSAMASLCGGPISIVTDSKVNFHFDVSRMLSWIDSIFATPAEKTHTIGRRALKNLITHNKEHSFLLAQPIEMWYSAGTSMALESYIEIVVQILIEAEEASIPFYKILGACLFILGNENHALRIKAAKLLRILEERQHKSSKLQDLEISVSDKTAAIYKLAHFEVSSRLAKHHSELAFHIFSDFSYYFKGMKAEQQRSMIAAMLPWVQTIELQLDPNGGPAAPSYMILVNLVELTISYGTNLHNEISALWQALATGPHGGNVQLVLDFIISLCLDRREQNFVPFAKQIVVHLASTPAGLKVIEFLLLHITPKAMVQERKESSSTPPEVAVFPYSADLSTILPTGNKQSGYSLGQICLILLVDLMVAPVQLGHESLPSLLQAVIVFWDHYASLVQIHAREMLVHLIHELVISKIEYSSTPMDKLCIEELAESIRKHDMRVVWDYDEKGDSKDKHGIRVPSAMEYLVEQVVTLFSINYPSIREDLGKMTLTWATSCPVRHLAYRSFQMFRCLRTPIDQQMLAGVLARLSNTVSDDETDILIFSLEILTTLRTIITELDANEILKYPQFFWTVSACLGSIHEEEFMFTLSILENLLSKLDLGDPAVIKLLNDYYPENWEGDFKGIQILIHKGVRSAVCLDKTLKLLESVAVFPTSELIGNEKMISMTVLANLPRYLKAFQDEYREDAITTSSESLARVSESHGWGDLSSTLAYFAQGRFRFEEDFLAQIIASIRTHFFPQLEFEVLTFLLSLLNNQISWFKIKIMEILCVIIPDIDLRKPEYANQGPDLISPLLRLLQTEFCPQALKVLDNVMTLTGTPMDKHHIRMSMIGAHSSKATRKEYARTECLYGIPEESGWSIPMPAIHAAITRNNVHAVFNTCATSQWTSNVEASTASVVLDGEDDTYQNSLMNLSRTVTLHDEGQRGGNMGDLVMKLDSLDDFFEDDASIDVKASSSSNTVVDRFAISQSEARESIYDLQTLPLLHKSLQQNNNGAFSQSDFNDTKSFSFRDATVMSPAAFTSSGPTPRPGLPARSITSPPTPQDSQKFSAYISTPDTQEDAFSDDETSSTRAPLVDKSFSIETVIKPFHGTRSGIRSGMRRLTGGTTDGKERERIKDIVRTQMQVQKSPKVPKVPDHYLQGNFRENSAGT